MALVAGSTFAAGCTDAPSRNAPTSPSATESAAIVEPPPPPLDVAGGIVSVVTSRADVPLRGPRVDAKPGDWMVQGGGAVAVVSAVDGRVVDYGPSEGEDGLVTIDSVVWDGLDDARAEVRSIEAVGGNGSVIHVEKTVLDRPLRLHIWTWLDGSTLRIDSVMQAASDKPVLSVTLGEIVRWGNTPTWVEGHGFIDRGGSFGAAFIGRECQGLAYAARSLDGPLLARFGSPDLAGFHSAARTGEVPTTVAPGESSARRRIAVTYSTASLGDAATRLPQGSAKETAQHLVPPPYDVKAGRVEIAHCAPPIESIAKLPPPPDPAAKPKEVKDKGKPSDLPVEHAPFATFRADERDIVFPAGCFLARFTAPGRAPGKWTKPKEFGSSAVGTLPTAGTLSWTATESGRPVPAKIVVRGLEATDDPDWGDDGIDGAADNAQYSADGTGTLAIPPGRYHVFVGRGPEYSLHEEDIEIAPDKSVSVVAKLERVVDTSGWISADLHVHAIPSFDAPVRLVDRVRTLAGVGVEVAVATDHNRITDYGPAIAEAGLGGKLVSVIGDEVTPIDVDFGHFNAFPLRASAEPPEARSVPPKDLFREMRAAGAPGGPIVLQVNHPRMSDIGYFDLLRLDPADVNGSIGRSALWDTNFDALEVFNGDHYADIPKVERVMMDWYALLRAGRRVTATGNSDSHKVTYQDAGEPRNWVRVPDDDPAHFDEKAFVAAINGGKVIVSNGPFITLTAGDASIGDTIKPGNVDVTIEVRAPKWIDVSKVELLDRGRLIRVFDGPFTGSGSRFLKTFSVRVEKGDFLTAVVRGERDMEWLARKRAKPFGFTNPIWVE